jgi:hypothetical protein
MTSLFRRAPAGAAIALGKDRAGTQRYGGRAQSVGGGLQRGDVVDGQEGIVVFAEAYLCTVEFLLDEAVAVKIIGGLEGEERLTGRGAIASRETHSSTWIEKPGRLVTIHGYPTNKLTQKG